jgi:hypothetical protein
MSLVLWLTRRAAPNRERMPPPERRKRHVFFRGGPNARPPRLERCQRVGARFCNRPSVACNCEARFGSIRELPSSGLTSAFASYGHAATCALICDVPIATKVRPSKLPSYSMSLVATAIFVLPLRCSPCEGFAQRDLWNVVALATRLLRLDIGRPDHLAPLVGFLSDELAEVGRRER